MFCCERGHADEVPPSTVERTAVVLQNNCTERLTIAWLS